jgi:hypothetical protein
MSTRNLPNEPGAWDSDFSYEYLARLLGVIARGFSITLLGEAAAIASADRPRAFVRHDVDVSLARALPLAQREAQWGVRATYHVMLDSPFYDARSSISRSILGEILACGHEVGLHYDVGVRKTREVDAATRERDIEAQCSEMEAIIGRPVTSLSFHLPVQELINGPLRVAGRVSGYGSELSQWYISDSRGRFREGDPLASVSKPRGPNLQLLVHPIWWGPSHVAPAVRLRDFLLEIRPALGVDYGTLRDKMWDHIIYDAARGSDE